MRLITNSRGPHYRDFAAVIAECSIRKSASTERGGYNYGNCCSHRRLMHGDPESIRGVYNNAWDYDWVPLESTPGLTSTNAARFQLANVEAAS